ncbi:hypothetical protein QQF64_025070 [Cirrhinus molitorella]|uniref:Uncharacterized protein n=1 Tax=Cirrhinus molitorella TaxID=172907 RepID=A0ABR3NNS6_9TELE
MLVNDTWRLEDDSWRLLMRERASGKSEVHGAVLLRAPALEISVPSPPVLPKRFVSWDKRHKMERICRVI